MRLYALASGKVVDLDTAVKKWPGEYKDSTLYLMPDGRYIVFLWEKEEAYDVPSREVAEAVIEDLF